MTIKHQPGTASQKNRVLMFIIRTDGFYLDWQEYAETVDPELIHAQADLFAAFQQDPDQALFDLAFCDSKVLLSSSSRYFSMLSHQFIEHLAARPEREFLREKVDLTLLQEDAESLASQAPFMNGQEYLDTEWIHGIWRRLHRAFASQISQYPGTVAEYLTSRHATVKSVGRICFHLVENKRDAPPFAFLATYVNEVAMTGKVRHLPLKNALQEYKNDQPRLLNLLSAVYQSAEKSAFASQLVESGEIFQPIGLTSQEAYQFLKDIPVFEESGIVCRMPDWWKRRSGSARVSITIGNREPSRVGFGALIDFQVNLSLGDLQLSADELRQLLSEAEGLMLIKGRWVEVDHEKLKLALQTYERTMKKMSANGLTLAEAFRLQLRAGNDLADDESGESLEVSQGIWLQTFLKQLAMPNTLTPVSSGDAFCAQLRPYQEKGLAWLQQMKDLQLGACLADDMGLGKTVQVIALLNAIRTRQREKSLLVVPASLINNWRQEISRFAPALQFAILHPSESNQPSAARTRPGESAPDAGTQPTESIPIAGQQLAESNDLLITTYGMLNRYEWLKTTHWQTLILDEAQAIKNPSTNQTRAAKQIAADWRVALTGTPIENRLSDLWSLFDFLNKGLLGTVKEFSHYARQLQEHQSDYTHLKQVLNPFILRRLKTDRSVIQDLPEKVEMKTFTQLSKKQLVLYRHFVDDLKEKLADISEGIQRKGLILTSIMKFKQICNHPDQFLGQAEYAEPESGKFARLREICETIYEKRERVLIFTQFREMTEPLRSFLEQVFTHEGLVLHGGTPVAKRRQIVEAFQGDAYVPFLVLSIKAGGVGLNLTAANHVIHFDRWWNPAVENQATDRAFRIGQQKAVLVHKFITTGTIEEKIDQMIEDKSGLARDIIPEKEEAWITEMSNQQLMDLFRFSG